MTLPLSHALGHKTLLRFEGHTPPARLLELIAQRPIGGVTLFRSVNAENPAQVRQLNQALQQAAQQAGQPPLLIAADQEGGQLMAVGNGPTLFPGNLALGATRSPELAEKVGHALGLECAAMGINVNYAPVCDVNSNPKNPAIGTRSFGEDPALAAKLASAMVIGMQKTGVAAVAKHFPGHGDAASDSHYGTPVIDRPKASLEQVEWPPFQAAIEAGVRLIMTAHIAMPQLQNGSDIPATLSPQILRQILRRELGFGGLIISDAMDMGAISQGVGQVIDSITAVSAGVDILLLNNTPEQQERVFAGLLQAARRGLLNQADIFVSAERVLALKTWLSEMKQPSLEIVGCAEHQALAHEIAQKSITLVKDEANLLPLKPSGETKIAVITPQPADLTPADTSKYITCALPQAIRRRHAQTDEFVVAHHPTANEISALKDKAGDYDLLIIGTINAYAQTEQATLVNELIATGVPVIAVAMRMPYDLQAFPQVETYLASYSILQPSMEATAQVIFGEIEARGVLPVSIA